MDIRPDLLQAPVMVVRGGDFAMTSQIAAGRVIVPADHVRDGSAPESILRRVQSIQATLAELIEHLSMAGGANLLSAAVDRDAANNGAQESDDTISTPLVFISCLGPFSIRVGGRQLPAWRACKAQALFQYLVNHRDRPAPRAVLIRALWPDPDALASESSLKVAVHSLRQLLAGAGSEELGLSVLARPSGYQLGGADVVLDVDQFERCYQAGIALEAEGKTAEAMVQFNQAADLYGGDFLEQSTDGWALLRREVLRDHDLFVLRWMAQTLFAANDYEGCIMRAQQLVAQDPCREDTYRLLMKAHARLGQRGRVRDWYQLCDKTLRAELQAAPEPETEEVYRCSVACGAQGK